MGLAEDIGFYREAGGDAPGGQRSRWDLLWELPDKEEGCKVLFRLAQDKDYGVRSETVRALSSSFALLLDKDEGWKDLMGLAQDQHSDVRMNANHSLGRTSIFRASEAREKNFIRGELESAVKFFEI